MMDLLPWVDGYIFFELKSVMHEIVFEAFLEMMTN